MNIIFFDSLNVHYTFEETIECLPQENLNARAETIPKQEKGELARDVEISPANC